MALNKRQSLGDNIFDGVVLLFGFCLFVVMIYPLYFVIIASFSDPSAVNSGRVWLLPSHINLEGYKRVLADERVWRGYRNTILYTIFGTFISLLFTLPAAYSLSRKDLVGRNAIMMYFVFTMFFSGGLIPTYLTISNFRLNNTFWVLLVPFSVSAYNLIIARTFFASSIPQELLEAATIDGCSNTRFFVSVVLPLSKAIIAVIGLYCAVGQWNQFFLSLIYVRNISLQPLQMVLRNILLQNQISALSTVSVNQNELQRVADVMKYSMIIISTAPVMCFYPFIQKYFAKGVMIGAVKG
ncbi:MAG: carbohydrate ABC transporter permease [Treponema sp.]|jgi:putative aldouronate transport system permease protein|nr:carbohydrate ABC transporter permease [Treponema sp.]